jgi:hypothetical protein
MSLEKYYSVPHAAKQLGVNEDNLRLAIHSGEIVAVNVAKNPSGERPRWRISESEMGKYLLRRRNPSSLHTCDGYKPIKRRRNMTASKNARKL